MWKRAIQYLDTTRDEADAWRAALAALSLDPAVPEVVRLKYARAQTLLGSLTALIGERQVEACGINSG